MAKKVEKKEKGFCGVKGLTEDMVVSAAEDLNASLGLDPAIDVEELEGEELLEAVKVSMGEVYENDQLEENTWAVMKMLDIEAQPTPEEEAPAKEEKPAKKGKKAAPKAEESDDEDDEAPKSKKGKKAPADDEDDEAPKSKKGKKAPADDEDDEAPKSKKGKGLKKAEPKYSRADAFGEALMAGKKDKKTIQQLIDDSDALYSEATGRRPNPKEAETTVMKGVKMLASCGYIELSGDTVKILVRP